MYKIKQIPEDFIVKEIPEKKFENQGIYTICLIEKKNYNTEDAIQKIAEQLKTSRKNISFAGIKDKHAVTYQYISIYKANEQKIIDLNIKDIKISIIGKSKSPLSLGSLKGNEFKITVRNLEKNQTINKIEKFPNFFDLQRFSIQNDQIGKLIIQKKFKEAVQILKEDKKYSKQILESLEKQPNNYIKAIQSIPQKNLLLYVHAFQSKIWNETLEECLKNKIYRQKIPLVGFEEIKDEDIKNIILSILQREKVKQRDFIIKEIPSLTLEGSERNTYAEIHDLKISKMEEDELNQGKKKITLTFWLDKGSYATMALKFILENNINK